MNRIVAYLIAALLAAGALVAPVVLFLRISDPRPSLAQTLLHSEVQVGRPCIVFNYVDGTPPPWVCTAPLQYRWVPVLAVAALALAAGIAWIAGRMRR